MASSYLREVLKPTWIKSPSLSSADWHDADEKTSKITRGLWINFLWEKKKEGRQQKCSQDTLFPRVDWTVWNSASPRMHSIPKTSEKHAAAVWLSFNSDQFEGKTQNQYFKFSNFLDFLVSKFLFETRWQWFQTTLKILLYCEVWDTETKINRMNVVNNSFSPLWHTCHLGTPF